MDSINSVVHNLYGPDDNASMVNPMMHGTYVMNDQINKIHSLFVYGYLLTGFWICVINNYI